MKKLNKIISALAYLSLAVGMFVGCADNNPDLTPVAIPTHIVGGIKQADVDSATWKAEDKDSNDFFPIKFKETDDGKVAEFTWKQDSNKWSAGYPTDTQEFQLTLGLSWDSVWANGEEIVLNEDYKKVTYGKGGKNLKITGLKQGETYTMKIKMAGSDVKIKVTGKAETFTELTLIANGLPIKMARLNGTYTAKVAASGTSLTYSISDGTKIWGLSDADAAAFTEETEYTYVEVKKASTIQAMSLVYYNFTATLTDKGAPKVKIASKEDLKGFAAKGLFGKWDMTYLLQENDDGSFSVTFEATAESSDCKIASEDWSKSYPADISKTTGEKETWIAEITAGGNAVECDGRDTGMANPCLKGMTIGKKYILKVTPLKGKISVKLEEKN